MGHCSRWHGALTGEEVPVAVGFILGLVAVGHGRHLLGRGAAHLLLLSCAPPHSWASQAHLVGYKKERGSQFILKVVMGWVGVLGEGWGGSVQVKSQRQALSTRKVNNSSLFLVRTLH